MVLNIRVYLYQASDKGKGESSSVNKHCTMKTNRGTPDGAPYVLDLGSRWDWMPSFTNHDITYFSDLPIYLTSRPSLRPSILPSIYRSIRPSSVHKSVCLSVYLSVYPTIYIYLSIWITNCKKGTSPKNSQYEFSPSWYSSATVLSLSAVSDSYIRGHCEQ
jgi:hypothetical protein